APLRNQSQVLRTSNTLKNRSSSTKDYGVEHYIVVVHQMGICQLRQYFAAAQDGKIRTFGLLEFSYKIKQVLLYEGTVFPIRFLQATGENIFRRFVHTLG